MIDLLKAWGLGTGNNTCKVDVFALVTQRWGEIEANHENDPCQVRCTSLSVSTRVEPVHEEAEQVTTFRAMDT